MVGAISAVLSGAAVAVIREVRKTDGAWHISRDVLPEDA